MHNSQILTIALAAVPTMLAVLVGLLINNARLSDTNARIGDTNARISELRGHMSNHQFIEAMAVASILNTATVVVGIVINVSKLSELRAHIDAFRRYRVT